MKVTILKKIPIPAAINLFVCLIFFSFINNTTAQEKSHSLSHCIQKGLEKNYALQVTRNNQEIAAANYSPGNAGRLPTITSTSQYNGAVNTTQQNMRSGDNITTAGIHNTSASSSVNMGMTIFKGFQVQNTYRKLGIQYNLGALSTQMSVENLVAQIAAEYNYYIEQLIQYKNLAYAVSLSRERVRIDEQRYLLGGASKMELLQSIVYLNADSSRLARQKEVLHTAQVRLNELMASENPGEAIIPEDTLIVINMNLVYDELMTLTLDNNTSLQIASKNQVVSELDYKIIESRSYPYLSMSTGYGYLFNTYQTGDYRSQQTHGVSYGLTLGVDIYDGFNRRREKNIARIEIENKEIQYKEVEQEVKADLITIYYAYENNLRLLQLEEQNLAIARENLDIALHRYKLGSLAGLELREVQKSLLDAEERLISVKYQAKLAEISLLHISGKIMDYL